jgi:hypothetical protein
VICPHCHESAKFVDYRDSGLHTLLGSGRHDRVYYHCSHCHQGWFPTDEELGIEHKQTPGCREVVSLTGVVDPFDEAADTLLLKLTGLNLSASTVQHTTEAVGADVAKRRAAGETLGPPTPWDWHRDAKGRRVAYVSLDATSVLQQGPRAEKAESRMPWVGSVFNPVPMHERKRKSSQPTSASSMITADILALEKLVASEIAEFEIASEIAASTSSADSCAADSASTAKASRASHRVWPTRYVCGVMSLEEIGKQLRAECVAVGIAQADVVLALTDGGNGLETCLVETVLTGLAREIVPILDFFHATEHLREFAKAWLPDEATRKAQVECWCHTLKHQGGTVLLTELETLDQTSRTDAQIEAHRLLTQYVRNNQHRMDYPTYIANGWEIGSGEIESACKSVINHRLGGPGMRWRLPGTTAVCQLRSLFRSEFPVWQRYWSRTVPT